MESVKNHQAAFSTMQNGVKLVLGSLQHDCVLHEPCALRAQPASRSNYEVTQEIEGNNRSLMYREKTSVKTKLLHKTELSLMPYGNTSSNVIV
eukprot:5942986-Amphidinium_carterae.1